METTIKASREWKDNGIHDLGCREWQRQRKYHLTYSLNSLKGAKLGTIVRLIMGDTRSLDCSTFRV